MSGVVYSFSPMDLYVFVGDHVVDDLAGPIDQYICDQQGWCVVEAIRVETKESARMPGVTGSIELYGLGDEYEVITRYINGYEAHTQMVVIIKNDAMVNCNIVTTFAGVKFTDIITSRVSIDVVPRVVIPFTALCMKTMKVPQ